MGKQIIPCFRCLIYHMCVFNLMFAGAYKTYRMPAPSRAVIFNSFDIFWIFKGCFDKHGWCQQNWLPKAKLATQSKIGYPKILWNKRYAISISVTAQKIKFSIKDFFSKCDQIRRKLFCAVCPWHHQQNFIMWLKLYSKYGPVTKNW